VRKALARVRIRPRTYYEIDASNPTQPYTAGQGTFIDQAIGLAGGKNVADGISPTGTPCPGTGCYFALALEALVRLDPQVIVLGDAAYGTTVASVKSRSGWETISAVQSGKIYPFDDELISRAGPRIVVGIAQLARRIHPEAFNRH
jgi:iron complex transport system substrate-binding protein